MSLDLDVGSKQNVVRPEQATSVLERPSLLISLAIFRFLATECRHNIALLSLSLMASLEATLSAFPSDMEAAARAATVVNHCVMFLIEQLTDLDTSSQPGRHTPTGTSLGDR
ncbi:hypothetical protein C8J56DRAFT_1056416 [Mycena floridula]|nr:hypothetical protein C8J56DRAFT_1056416 [Mycena floridula]